MIEPHLRSRQAAPGEARAHAVVRSPEAKLDEAVGLARAIDLNVVTSGIVSLGDIRPSTFVGKGKVEEIAGLVKTDAAGIVVMDCALSPVQQRNLEKAWGAKVLDRTGLILEIFGRRARTREGALSSSSRITYQKSRLVRSGRISSASAAASAFSAAGRPRSSPTGAGSRASPASRASSTRSSARASSIASRKRVPYPIVALVGYTNAGKSTLFNRMTRASVLSPTCCSPRSIRHCVRSPCRRTEDHPVRHRRLHLGPADHAGGGVSRHPGGGDRS